MEATSATQETYAVPIHAYPTLDERIDEEMGRFDLVKKSIPLGVQYVFHSIVQVDWIEIDQRRTASITVAGFPLRHEYRFNNSGTSIRYIHLSDGKEPQETLFNTWDEAITDMCKTLIIYVNELALQAGTIAQQARNQAWRYNFPS